MIALSAPSSPAFSWVPANGISAPAATPFTGDSQIEFSATPTNAYGLNQTGLALETVSASDPRFSGSTPLAQLQAFRTAVERNPLPVLTTGANPTISYTDINGNTLVKTYNSTGIINGHPVNEQTSWQMISNPWIFQSPGGNVIVSSGSTQTTYNLTNWTISTRTVSVPGAPGNLSIAPGSGSSMLSWTGASNATSYNVMRSTTSDGPYQTVATNVVSTQYTDTGLAGGTTYYYVVSGSNSVGAGPTSAEASVYIWGTDLDLSYYWDINGTTAGCSNSTNATGT